MTASERSGAGLPEGFRRRHRRANKLNRRRVKTLQELHAVFENAAENPEAVGQLIASLENAAAGRVGNRVRAYTVALEWGLQRLDRWMQEDPLFDVDWQAPATVGEVPLQAALDLLGTRVTYQDAPHEILDVQLTRTEVGQTIRFTLRALGAGEEPQRDVLPWGEFTVLGDRVGRT